MTKLAISARQLRKVFGSKAAVRGLTLDVRQGEVFGFLGPNGAGKSTSVKMLLGLVKPSGGQASVLGKPIGDRAIRGRMGFLPEHFRFYDWLTALELLRVHGQLCGMANEVLRRRIPEMLDAVGLTPHSGRQIKTFSKGMLQRVGLAQALINEPDLLFLDEPTSGLDPVGRRLVRDLIRAQRERGATVFLNSHLLGEVEATCDRVAFIKAGVVIETREMSSFQAGQLRVAARVRNLTSEMLMGLERWASDVAHEGEQLSMNLRCEEAAPVVVRYLVERGVEVFDFTRLHASLEDRFLQILGADEGL